LEHANEHEDESVDNALLRLAGLTSTESADLLDRLPKTKKNVPRASADVLSWLTDRLGGLNQTQMASIVIGHPPVLRYSIEANLEPSIAFFQGALELGETAGLAPEEGGENDAINRLAALLCESPSLLEYNVKRRLSPRLERVLAAASSSTNAIAIDEVVLSVIATKTDSRFDEWLHDEFSDDGGESSSTTNNVQDQAAAAQQEQTYDDGWPSSYVVVSNLQSGSNIGNILRSASIFGCREFVVVGQKRYRLTGDHGSRFDLKRRHVWSHEDAKEYLHEKEVRIYGVEIMEGASPLMRYDPETGIMRFPFDRKWKGAAFVMGNEGRGLSEKQRELCDEFLFIPQTRGGATDGGGSASLNVACAATVVLQAYCTWAGYPDADRQGEKFVAPSGESQRLRFQE
jgi:tRNA G18 (ribose-2'-O)-methylase SpoU